MVKPQQLPDPLSAVDVVTSKHQVMFDIYCCSSVSNRLLWQLQMEYVLGSSDWLKLQVAVQLLAAIYSAMFQLAKIVFAS